MIIYKFVTSNLQFITFLIAVLTFLITFVNFYRNRPKLDIIQIPGSTSSIITPDFIDANTPDVYSQKDFRVLIDVVITNKSALPISIIEFVLNKKLVFNSYSKPGSIYKVTFQPGHQKSEDGVLTASGTSKSKQYLIGDYCFNPVFQIPPYTSTRGLLFFQLQDQTLVKEGKNDIKIITSRKSFNFKLEISESLHSALELPSEIQRARKAFS
ncbi:hypothetical protein [Peribacillus frigoritolerans]|uniref:hypothetical protein n=1 Tax=Peribacillus frigoritolerans TaxID=450367 RepID=UPI003F822921